MMHSVILPSDSHSTDDSTYEKLGPQHNTSSESGSSAAMFGNSDALPMLADSSWLGARVSPIPSVDEGEDEDWKLDRVTEPYRRAIREMGTNERSSLLTGGIHPMWNPNRRNFPEEPKEPKNPDTTRASYWGRFVVGISGIHLCFMGMHDLFLWYLQMRRGVQLQYPLAWSIPYLGPTARVLLRFGAYSPTKVYLDRQAYRIFSSLAVTSSLSEWVAVAVSWWQLEKMCRFTVHETTNWSIWWPTVYIVGIGTGQLWMAAFSSSYTLSGCAGWGTSGVLCAVGVSRPDHRFPLFLLAIVIVMLNLLQSTSDVFGAIGASFFGWSYFGVTVSPPFQPTKENDEGKRLHCLNWLALITVVKLWVIPIVVIFLRN